MDRYVDGVKQVSDSDLQALLDRNHLFIEFNAKSGKFELRRKVVVKGAARSIFLTACEFRTPLIVAARQIDERRVSKASRMGYAN